MANTLNTLLAMTFANEQEERRRQQENYNQAASNTVNAVSQEIAYRRAQEQQQREQAQQMGAAASVTGTPLEWKSPEFQQLGEMGALSQKADIARQQAGREFELSKLAEVLQGKQNVANIGAGARVQGAEIGAASREGAAQIGADSSERRGKMLADAMKYSADRRMMAMLQRPALNAFWQEKKYWDTGQGGQAMVNLNTAAQHMERLRGAISELKNVGAVHLNKYTNAYEYETGDPRILNYKTIAHVETREIARFLNASGMLTDAEKESTNALTNENLPMEAQETVLRDLWHMATDKHEALMHQRNHMFEEPDQYQSWSPGAIEAAGKSGAKIDTTEGNGPDAGGHQGGKPPPVTPPKQGELLQVGTRVKFPDGTIRPVTNPVPLPDGAQVVQ